MKKAGKVVQAAGHMIIKKREDGGMNKEKEKSIPEEAEKIAAAFVKIMERRCDENITKYHLERIRNNKTV